MSSLRTLLRGATALVAIGFVSASFPAPALAQDMDTVMVGGAAMYPGKTIVENAVKSQDHTTLVAAVKAAGLVETLSGEGPFTVFAPVNSAFDALPAGTVEGLLKPEAKDALTHVLTYHVVPGRITAESLREQAKGGAIELKTVAGDPLTVSVEGDDVVIAATSGGKAKITQANVLQSNGVIHAIDAVLVPKMGEAVAEAGTMEKPADAATAEPAMADAVMGEEKTVEVGGAPMYPSKTIVENAVNSQDHTTLVAAVKEAGLVETLSGEGPFTVFAPTNTAFEKLPSGTVETLMKPESKDALTHVLTYHVVAGRLSAEELLADAKRNGGVNLTTVAGEPLTIKARGSKLYVFDSKGGAATITIADVFQKNGVIHVVDDVLLPRK